MQDDVTQWCSYKVQEGGCDCPLALKSEKFANLPFVTPANYSAVFPTLLSWNSKCSPTYKSSISVITCFKGPYSWFVHEPGSALVYPGGICPPPLPRSSKSDGSVRAKWHSLSDKLHAIRELWFLKFDIWAKTDINHQEYWPKEEKRKAYMWFI